MAREAVEKSGTYISSTSKTFAFADSLLASSPDDDMFNPEASLRL